MLEKHLPSISIAFNLLMSLGAFYLGVSMYLGNGVFATFPQDWGGRVPFNDWMGLAIFSIIFFGFGNAIASIFGFTKKEIKLFVFTIVMGLLLLLCTLTQIILLQEWYLATVQFLILGFAQISLGIFGLLAINSNKK